MSKQFNEWLDVFIEEKDINLESTFEFEGKSGWNLMPYGVVIECMKATGEEEQKKIKNMIVKIDFADGDVCHYLRHLGQALDN